PAVRERTLSGHGVRRGEAGRPQAAEVAVQVAGAERERHRAGCREDVEPGVPAAGRPRDQLEVAVGGEERERVLRSVRMPACPDDGRRQRLAPAHGRRRELSDRDDEVVEACHPTGLACQRMRAPTTLAELIDEATALRPRSLAVADAESAWTYGELTERANRLA